MKIPEQPIVILGSSGFLGTGLNFHLSQDPDLDVISASRSGTATLSRGYSRESIGRFLDEINPAAVINCVGVVGHEKVESNPTAAHQINVELPELLSALTREREIRFVHFSSDSVYSGIPEQAPFTESSTPSPFSRYGVQKLESEYRVLGANPQAVVLRINFFGWSLSGAVGLLDHFVSHALRGSQPIGYPSYFASSVYVGELAKVVLASARGRVSGIFNVGSPDSHSKWAFGREVFTQLGLDPAMVISSDPSIWASEGTKARDLSMSSRLIESTLGIELLPQLQGIRVAFEDCLAFLDFGLASSGDPRLKLFERAEK